MKCPRLRGRWPWLGLLLVPALAWAVVLALVPTEWARVRMVDRLAAATGRSARIGALRLGIFGDLKVQDLSLAERSTPTDPWIRVAEARVDVHLGQILIGRCEPRQIVVDGAAVRVWRRKDGTPEIGDFLRAGPAGPAVPGRGSHAATAPVPIALKVRGANIRIVDEPSGTKIDLLDVEAEGSAGGRMVTLDRLKGRANGGTVEMAARLDRDPISPRFEVEVKAAGIKIDPGMAALAYLIPVVAGATDGAGGKLGLVLSLKGQGATRAEVRRTLRGQGSVLLDPIDLDGSKFLASLDSLGDCPKQGRIGWVSADLAIDRGRIASEDLTIQVSRFPFVFGGWTDFDGRFDYAPRVDRITARLPREARSWIAELKVNFDQLAGLRLRGTPDKVEVTVHGHPLTGDPGRSEGEREKFREAARRIRDRFFR